MASARFFLILAVLFQAAVSPATALNFPLFPGTPPVLCSLADAPWYLCDQAENFDGEAIPSLYERVSTFFNFGAATGAVENHCKPRLAVLPRIRDPRI